MIAFAIAMALQQAPIIHTGADLQRLCEGRSASEIAMCESYIQGAAGATDDIADGMGGQAFCYPTGLTIEEVRLAVVRSIRARPEWLGSRAGGVIVLILMQNYPCQSPDPFSGG